MNEERAEKSPGNGEQTMQDRPQMRSAADATYPQQPAISPLAFQQLLATLQQQHMPPNPFGPQLAMENQEKARLALQVLTVVGAFQSGVNQGTMAAAYESMPTRGMEARELEPSEVRLRDKAAEWLTAYFTAE